MDKYEYRVRLDEIRKCIDDGDYQQAAELADTIDWSRVKSVMTLCMISDLYKINRRFKESRDVLLMAYDRNPNGRLIIYSLCELSIKLDDFVGAIQYYNKFSSLAPDDSRIYMLKYRIYEAQNVPLEERIEVLEELKKKELKDKWIYELAYLYHRVGLETKCVEECDEIFAMFGEGRFVKKALDLKMLHMPLTPEQQAKYDMWRTGKSGAEAGPQPAYDADVTMQGLSKVSDISSSVDADDLMSSPTARIDTGEEDDIHVKPMDVENPYNTINLQQALAANMQEVLGNDDSADRHADVQEMYKNAGDEDTSEDKIRADDADMGQDDAAYQEDTQGEDMANGDADRYSSEPDGYDAAQEDDADTYPGPEQGTENDEMFGQTRIYKPVNMQLDSEMDGSNTVSFAEAHRVIRQMEDETAAMKAITDEQADLVPGARTGVLTPLNTLTSGFDDVLKQDSDGQISLVMPDREAIEKQITGQLSIDDVMSEWERMKQENEKKRMNEVRQRILQNTGNLFDDFDEATKNGLLEQLEKAFVAAIIKESKEKGSAPDTAILTDEEITRETEKAVKQATEPLPQISDEDLRAAQKDAPDADVTDADDGVEEIEEIQEPEETGKTEETDEGFAGKDIGEDISEETARHNESLSHEDDVSEEDNSEEAAKEDAGEQADGDSVKDEKEPERQTDDASEQKHGMRVLSEDENKLFAKYVHHRKQREQIAEVLDKMGMAAYTGNVIVTSEEESVSLNLTMKLIHALQVSDSNFLGKVAKVSGNALNRKNVAEVLDKIEGGALVITRASGMSPKSMKQLLSALESDSRGLIVFILDAKDRIDRMTAKIPQIKDSFCGRVDLEGLDDDSLVEYASHYAYEREYSIDELGVLALHTRIENMQSSDHTVTVAEVKDLVDEAISYAEKKNPKHLMDTLFGKRYDDDDMIILHENDFMHNM